MGGAASKIGHILVKIGDATGGSPQATTAATPGDPSGSYVASRPGQHSEVLFFPDGELPCRNYLNGGVCVDPSATR
jgi:hypothetical protein